MGWSNNLSHLSCNLISAKGHIEGNKLKEVTAGNHKSIIKE